MNEELIETLAQARENRREATNVPGLPDDSFDAQAYLWALQEPWKHGNRAQLMTQARESFSSWLNTIASEGPWED